MPEELRVTGKPWIKTLDAGHVSGECWCHKRPVTTIGTTTHEAITAWSHYGALIQNVMPTLSSDDREFLISGMCAEGYDTTFEEEE